MLYKRPQWFAGLIGLCIAGLIMSGCGASATPAAEQAQVATLQSQLSAAQSGAGGSADGVMTLQAQMPAAAKSYPDAGLDGDAAQAAPPGAVSGEQVAQGTPGPNDNPLVNALPQDRMIIKNGEITLLVQDTHTAVDQVTQIAVDNGGYLLSSQAAQDAQGVTNATLTIAVRSDQYETALRRLRQIALTVQTETSTGQDVTTEYVDLNSRLTNLEATRDRIAKLLDQAKTVDEAMKINQQLSDIEGQIEQVKGRMTYLSGRSAYSTITITLNQKVDYTPTPTPTPTLTPTPTSPWSLSPTIRDATSAQVDLVRALLTLAVWIIVVPGPYLVIAGLAFWGLTVWSKRRKPSAPPPPATPKSED